MPSPHLSHLRTCLSLAEQAPALPSNFRVGALLLSRKIGDVECADDRVLATGYTMQLPGNTHAEQCCLANYYYARRRPSSSDTGSKPDLDSSADPNPNPAPERIAEVLPSEPGRQLVMYVTMEPCGFRLSGNMPCAARIAALSSSSSTSSSSVSSGERTRGRIEKVYFGVKEPETFVGESQGCKMLSEAGVQWRVVGGLEREILLVAMEGHRKGGVDVDAKVGEVLGNMVVTDVDDVSEGERERQARLKRNPKKKVLTTE